MKKSFMNNLKNFVDSNVRHRIDKVTNNSGNFTNSDLLNDDLILVERHFDELHQFCVDTEMKISNMLQSIHVSSATPSQLGAYTQNVQAGLNHLSHNLAQQAASIASASSSTMAGFNNSTTNFQAKTNDHTTKNSSTPNIESIPIDPNRLPSSDPPTMILNSPQPTNNTTARYELDSKALTELHYDTLQRFKKLPVVKFYKSLCKSSSKLKQDSLLATTLTHFSKMQAQLTNLYLVHEQMIDTECLNPIQQMLEVDIPNVLKLKKLCVKMHNDLESARGKYNGANQKQQQQMQSGKTNHTSYLVSQNNMQQANTNKLELLKNELDEYVTKFEQTKDLYEAELFAFVCREPELVNLLKLFYRLLSSYHQQVISIIQNYLPAVDVALDRSPRKFVFGTPLCDHVRCTGRKVSPVIELCVHFLHLQALKEEGLFRIPGSQIKIKKLKNGINALFLTLISSSELENDQQRQTGHSCVVSLYELFKSTVGQQPRKQRFLESPLSQNSVLKNSLAVDDSPMGHTNYSHTHSHDHEVQRDSGSDAYIMDVHSIAGLLKLYLRELPEPLFTHALYDDWVNCVSNQGSSSEQRLEALGRVMNQLPHVNYANLRHLIKFLNKLTHHQEQNKMTSMNLAIAMAPSLIWPKPSNEHNQNDEGALNPDNQTLNSQMCSFGVSASHHAMILEALINHANVLFPEAVDFELIEFSNISLGSSTRCSPVTREGRNVKSTSPTCLSTTSSSSFSSSASNPNTSAPLNKGHSRKGGSMEGLLASGTVQEIHSGPQTNNMSSRSIGRPVSVQVRRDDYSLVRRDFIKESLGNPSSAKHEVTTVNIRSSNKPPAPPVPPPSIRHQQERLKLSKVTQSVDSDDSTAQRPQPVSLRGTGQSMKTRPSVPPPERPAMVKAVGRTEEVKSVSNNNVKSVSDAVVTNDNVKDDIIKNPDKQADDNKILVVPDSPTFSSNKVSADEDSSFDDSSDDHHHDNDCSDPSIAVKQSDPCEASEPARPEWL